jgi:hypothetical protein
MTAAAPSGVVTFVFTYAVKSTVPESMWPEIARKLEGGATEPFADDADAFYTEDDVYGDEEPEE